MKDIDAWKNLVEIWSNTEKIIFFISNDAGDLPRESAFEFAGPILEKLHQALDDEDIELDSEMVDVKNYPKAYVEVIEILNLLEIEEYNKIDKAFINMLNNRKDTSYSFELDNSIDIEQQKILKETRAILAYIFMNYLGTEEEKISITNKFQNDIQKSEQLKHEQYSTNVFQDKQVKNDENIESNIIVYHKESFIQRIINKIKSIFKI